ncbi:MAG: hypothetical protein AAF703_04470 [Cyanobacteria bacterium P01_D01_bin.105]
MERTRVSILTTSLIAARSACKRDVRSPKTALPITLTISSAVVACLGWLFCSTAAFAQPERTSERFVDVRNPEQVPTARYGRGEAVDLSLIVEEWRDRYPATPVFVCTCRNQACGDATVWPFREYSLYQPFVALGDANATRNEATGFKCFDIETGRFPQQG